MEATIKETKKQFTILANGKKVGHIHKQRENLEVHIDVKKHFQIIKLNKRKEIVVVLGKKEKLGGTLIYQK